MRFSKLALLGAFIITLGIAGCNENDNPVTPPTAPNAPTGLMATSRSATSIGLKWTAPAAGVTPTGYMITYTPAGGTAQTMDVASTSTATDITGLTEGKIYTITVSAKNSTAVSTASSAVMWAPASRLTGTFKIYSSKSTANGSGLRFSPAAVLKIADGPEWDICFDDKDGRPLVGSPGVSGYVDANNQFPGAKDAKIVALGRDYLGVNSLDDIYDVDSLSVAPTGGFKEVLKDLSTVPDKTKGYGFVVRSRKTVSDPTVVNFAKVLVKSDGSKFVQGTAPEEYIEVEVSYQTITNVPFALVMPVIKAEEARKSKQSPTK